MWTGFKVRCAGCLSCSYLPLWSCLSAVDALQRCRGGGGGEGGGGGALPPGLSSFPPAASLVGWCSSSMCSCCCGDRADPRFWRKYLPPSKYAFESNPASERTEGCRRIRWECRSLKSYCKYRFPEWSGGYRTLQGRRDESQIFEAYICAHALTIICTILSKKCKTLCFTDHISVVTLLLALNLVSRESLFVNLSNSVTFVRIRHLWDEQHIWEVGEVAKKIWKKISLLAKKLFIHLLILALLFWAVG